MSLLCICKQYECTENNTHLTMIRPCTPAGGTGTPLTRSFPPLPPPIPTLFLYLQAVQAGAPRGGARLLLLLLQP